MFILQAGMASLLTISSALPAFANEYDLFAAPAPITTGYVDDTESLWTSTKKTLNEKTQEIEVKLVYTSDTTALCMYNLLPIMRCFCL